MPSRDPLLLNASDALAALTPDWLVSLAGTRRSNDRRTASVDLPPSVHELRLADGTESSRPTLDDSVAGGPFRKFEVGGGGHGDCVRLRNDADVREGRVVVTAGGSELLDLTDEFPAGGSIDVVFREKGDYRVGVRLDDVERIEDLPAERFDGTDSLTLITLAEDGTEATTRELDDEGTA